LGSPRGCLGIADERHTRTKLDQEKLVVASDIPCTIIRAAQFLESLSGIAAASADGNTIRFPPVMFQPIAADDVAAIVAEVALAAPCNGIIEVAVPLGDARLGRIGLDEWLRGA
jgi:uncharacterized protein YbjT (DUF2867 family)